MRLFFLLVFLIYQINANNYVSRWNNSSICRPPSISQSQQLIRRTVTTISRPRCETRNIPSYQPMPCMPCPVIPICPQPCIPAIPILPPCPRPYPPPRPRPCPPPRPIPCVPPFDPAWRWFSLRRHRGLAMLRRRWRRRGSCGFRPRSFGRYLVALSPKYMDRITGPFGRPALCGQEFCVRVRHGNRWVVGKIADTACHGNNIEVSRAMYHRLADPGNGTIRVKWRLVSCCRHPPGESSGWRFHGCRDSSSSSCSSSSSSSCSHNHRRFDRNGGGRIDWNGSSSGSDSSSSND